MIIYKFPFLAIDFVFAIDFSIGYQPYATLGSIDYLAHELVY